ncbi:hypothetical protein L596_028085 [Steinernema carpocapsae]|uniref:EF-hand domain-containing protein n=1 Tax=Steinernema carpocapsae TaxID=34508 RepID=A0A4U5LXI0_STECR|nr:hypothetical protein L596_028085 [Steinernema carpocapsae]
MKFVATALVAAFVAIALAQDGPEITDALIEQQFKSEDLNKDGFVTVAELKESVAKLGGGKLPADVVKIIEENFRATDTNKDGKLTLTEVKKQIEKNEELASQAE